MTKEKRTRKDGDEKVLPKLVEVGRTDPGRKVMRCKQDQSQLNGITFFPMEAAERSMFQMKRERGHDPLPTGLWIVKTRAKSQR